MNVMTMRTAAPAAILPRMLFGSVAVLSLIYVINESV